MMPFQKVSATFCNETPPPSHPPPAIFCNIDPISFSFQICKKKHWAHMGKPFFFFLFLNFCYLKNDFFGRRCPKCTSKNAKTWYVFRAKSRKSSKSSKTIQNHPKSAKNHFFFSCVPNRPGMGFLTFLTGKEHDFRCFWMIFDRFWIVLMGF